MRYRVSQRGISDKDKKFIVSILQITETRITLRILNDIVSQKSAKINLQCGCR